MNGKQNCLFAPSRRFKVVQLHMWLLRDAKKIWFGQTGKASIKLRHGELKNSSKKNSKINFFIHLVFGTEINGRFELDHLSTFNA